MQVQEQKQRISDKEALKMLGLAGGVAAVATIAVAPAPAHAAGSADISAEVTALGTLAATALVVALSPFGIYYGFRIIKRVMAGA